MNKELLKALLDDHRMYHSEFQIDHFIIGKAGPTAYGMYKQTLRELSGRYCGLRDLYLARETLLIDIEELEAACGSKHDKVMPPSFEQRRKAVELTRCRMNLDDLARNIRDSEREFRRFYALAEALKKTVGKLTPQRRAELDRDMWHNRFKLTAAMDLLTAGRLASSTLESIRAMPREWRDGLLSDIRNDKDLLKWFHEYEPSVPQLPELERVDGDVRRLLETIEPQLRALSVTSPPEGPR